MVNVVAPDGPAPAATTGPAAILIGPMGSGKSTVGAVLADRLGVPLLDTDAEVERRCAMSIPDLFARHGEDYFRDVEHDVVVGAVRAHRGVVSLGGGAVLRADTQTVLRGLRVVFLDVTLDAAARRAGFDEGRPLLSGADPRRTWERLMEERRPVYEDLAALRLDVSSLSPDQAAGEILSQLGLDGA